jgi:NitT/TauT family transport system substrate-binding protein
MPLHRHSCALVFASMLVLPGNAQAEGTIRILEQFGISYLPLHVIRDQDPIAQHGAEQGLEMRTELAQASGGAAANDALLSGSVDVAAAGLAPLPTIWDRTRGSFDVKGIAALAEIDFALLTTNPEVESVTDFGEGDRIAVPSVGVSVQARALQLAAAKALGDDQFEALDALTVSLPHPDATRRCCRATAP